MKKKIKRFLNSNRLGIYFFQVYHLWRYYCHQNVTTINKIFFLFKLLFRVRIYRNQNKGTEIKTLLENVSIKINDNDDFVYFIDLYKSTGDKDSKISNISIDYERVINNSLDYYKQLYFTLDESIFKYNQLQFIEGLESYIDRIIIKINSSSTKNKETKIQYLKNIKNNNAKTFREGLQRILFINQVMWQTNHRLNGFGRLDKILYPLYINDVNNNNLSRNEVKEIIKNFYKVLHENFWFKSNDLIGDTGQIIILGGLDENNHYLCNDLTYLFIECLKELHIPDPKIFLRVSVQTPNELWQLALDCIATGIGSPLIANDEKIIPSLLSYGYDKPDAYNYVTSACWEPLIVGKSLGQNNISFINFLQPLENLFESLDLNSINSFDEFLQAYIVFLEKYLSNIMLFLDDIQWEKDPLLSLYTDDCLKKQKDISDGGAKYNDYGITGVALSNTINSLLVIKSNVFDQKMYTLQQLFLLKKQNSVENINNLYSEFGEDNETVIDLTKKIMDMTSQIAKKYKNNFGGGLKFGISAPSYIIASKDFPASLDGRKYGSPFGVHISSQKSMPYTELIEFAGKLDYSSNKINGNVVDFVVSKNFIEDNMDKFLLFMKNSIQVGFFELQINVTSSKTLIEAKNHPELYPNLIVRVWGFSAYFNDLPEEYKNLIIERTLKSEANNSL